MNTAGKHTYFSGRRRWLKVFFSGLVVAIAVLAFLVLGTTPKNHDCDISEEDEMAMTTKLVTRLSQALRSEDGQIVETCVMRLSSEEINTLLAVAMRHYNNRNSLERQPKLSGSWQNYFFSMGYSVPVIGDIAVNVYADIYPEYLDQSFRCTIRYPRAGWLMVPSGIIQYFLDHEMDKMNQSDFVSVCSEVIVDLKAQPDGSIVIYFKPEKIGLLIALLLR